MTIKKGDILLEKYRIEKCRLGPGAYSNVYLATHLDLKVPRALKILRKGYEGGLGSQDFADYEQRFRLEAQLGAKLDHPNIVRVYDFESSSEQLVLVMEYCPGGSLAEVIEKVRDEERLLPIDYVLQIAEQVSSGLAELHKKQIVHRDVKPANILLDKNGTAKVADLGLAQVPGGPSMRSRLSEPIPHPGTLGYMSPEQKSSGDLLTFSSDIYSLGLVLFELLTGKVYSMVRPGTRLVDVRKDAPESVDELVAKLLVREAEERYWDGEEVFQVIREGSGQEEARREAVRKEFEEQANEEAKRKAEEETCMKKGVEEEQKREKETASKDAIEGFEKLKLMKEKRAALMQVEQLKQENERLKTELHVKREFPKETEPNKKIITKNLEINERVFQLKEGLEMEFIRVPNGGFLYGDKKVRKSIEKDYWIGKYPVTNEQYQQFIIANPKHRVPKYWNSESRLFPIVKAKHPVVSVSWEDAQMFCKWAGCRLPTEEEWEKAARGIDGRTYPWGEDWSDGKYCNSRAANEKDTTPVTGYPLGVSPYGVWGMSGNICEWTNSKFDNYKFVLRGGSWVNDVGHLHSSYRFKGSPGNASYDDGFRCVVSTL